MEIISLELYGRPFVDWFSISENVRVSRSNPDDGCLTYIHSGTQEFYSPTQKLVIKNEEALITKCGNYVANTVDVSPTSQLSGMVFHLDPASIRKSFGDKDLSFLKPKQNKDPVDPAFLLGKNELIKSFVNSLTPYFKNTSFIRDELLAVKLQELVTILLNSGKNPVINYILGSLHIPEHFEFDRVIEANLYNNLSIPELAHLTHRSESTFKRDFKKYYHISPAKYIKTAKLTRASELLKQTNKSVGEIAWVCGFENVTHFSTSFARQHSKSPRAYRNDLK